MGHCWERMWIPEGFGEGEEGTGEEGTGEGGGGGGEEGTGGGGGEKLAALLFTPWIVVVRVGCITPAPARGGYPTDGSR